MSLDQAQAWLQSWSAQVSQRAEAAAVLSGRVAELESAAEGGGGAVRVRVDATGRLVGLDLDEQVRDMAAVELAQLILHVVARAQHGLTGQVADAVAATVGADSETGQAVLDSFERRFPDPDPPADEDRRSRSGG
jgi:DNA-binding protein YbaB